MIVPFDADAHLGEVNEWNRAQRVPAVAPTMLPRVGFIVPGVAVGWLYQTDSAMGLIENFVTNPGAPRRDRWEAISEIALALAHHAKSVGIQALKITTGHRSLGRIAIRHGCVYQGPAHVLSKEV